MDSLILDPKYALRFPAGDGVSQDVIYDLRPLANAKARLVDLQAVTKLKAGELLHTFIRAWSDTAQLQKQAERHLMRAKRRVKEVRAIVVLDRGPEELKKRGLATTRSPGGSEDLRDSVVSMDPDYQLACERLEQIQAVVGLLEIETETFKMAYFSVSKLIDPYDKTTNDTSGGTDGEIGAMTDSEKVEEFVRQHATIKQANYTGGAFGAPKL